MFAVIDLTQRGKGKFSFLLNTKIVHRERQIIGDKETLEVFAEEMIALDLTLRDIKGMGAVTGAGGFTSARLAVTIANTLAYALRIPVAALPPDWNAETLASELRQMPVGQYASARYSGEPNIGGKQ